MKKILDVYCPFCNNKCFFRYKMNTYDIWQCGKCNTGQVWPMSEPKVLEDFYNGFIPNLDVRSLPTFEIAAKELFPDLGLKSGNNLKMLDIGGGGGFFSKAFENLGYGQSTYVDLDPQSCDFAKDQLGLERVFNCDALNLDKHIDDHFDFVYTRHLIEHLLEPTTFLQKVMGYVNENGIFVVQCPMEIPWNTYHIHHV